MALFGKKTEDKKVTPAEAPKTAPVKSVPTKTVKAITSSDKISSSKNTNDGKTLSGVVVSSKMKDTVVVKVDRFVKVPKYERFMKISKKYKAHDAGNTKKEGDKVIIVECRPISKDKNFKVI